MDGRWVVFGRNSEGLVSFGGLGRPRQTITPANVPMAGWNLGLDASRRATAPSREPQSQVPLLREMAIRQSVLTAKSWPFFDERSMARGESTA